MSTLPGRPPEAIEVPRQIGHVKLGEPLGEGASGVVFAAYDQVLRRRVAVKFLRTPIAADEAGGLAGFVDGVRAAAGVKHPHVLGVHHVDAISGIPYLVTEYVDGISLRELTRQAPRLEVPLAGYVMRTVSAGVAALHDAHIVHRDVKPANVLLERSGATYVCDFGLARAHGEIARYADSREVAGSPLYMAPEVFDGVVSPQGDVYALGVMLFELLTGRAPFAADSVDGMKRCHRDQLPPLELLENAGIPDELREIAGRALHKQRILRYKSAGHLQRALGRAAPPGMRDEVLRDQLAALVARACGVVDPEHPAANSDAPVQTTFDLLARRAAEKRLRDSE